MLRWVSQLGLGVRLGATGGAGARLRTLLTAVGVASGVVLLLVAASVPHLLSVRNARIAARAPRYGPGPGHLRLLSTDTTFGGHQIAGFTLQPASGHAPVPPGLTGLPGPYEMVVSPALAHLLAGRGGAELRRRLDARVIGTIGDAGLTGPDEERFYRGASNLAARGVTADVSGFGASVSHGASSPLITLLLIVIVMALLLPVAVFVATASRFGAEDRDRRLAALRLLGADRTTTARIAAGESLLGALGGLMLGIVMFILLRPFAQHVDVAGVNVFASDIQPTFGLAVLVGLLVPSCVVLANLVGMRRVMVEPLGVSRRARPLRRRLGWRLLPTAVGFALLVALIHRSTQLNSTAGQMEAAAGVLLALVGLTAVLPWLVQGVVRLAPDGPLSWLLAIRRLRSDEGSSTRVVGAIGLAVAGAIALQILFSAAEARSRLSTTASTTSGSELVTMQSASRDGGKADARRLRAVVGVQTVLATAETALASAHPITIAPCPVLRRLASLTTCRDGYSFVVRGIDDPALHRGQRLRLDRRAAIRIPTGVRFVAAAHAPPPVPIDGLLLTPAAARRQHLEATTLTAVVKMRPGTEAAPEPLRDNVARIDPYGQVSDLTTITESHTLVSLRHAVAAGAVVVLLMIGASLLVAVGEQLRQRRRVLAVLTAFGTRRSTLAWSVLWQAALTILSGLALATALGVALGIVLMQVVDLRVSVSWSAIALLVGAGAAVVTAVTVLTLPLLWRLMSPDALRVE